MITPQFWPSELISTETPSHMQLPPDRSLWMSQDTSHSACLVPSPEPPYLRHAQILPRLSHLSRWHQLHRCSSQNTLNIHTHIHTYTQTHTHTHTRTHTHTHTHALPSSLEHPPGLGPDPPSPLAWASLIRSSLLPLFPFFPTKLAWAELKLRHL